MGANSIGQVARQAGAGVEIVRFYEHEGLLQEPARRACGVDAMTRTAHQALHHRAHSEKENR